MKVSQLPLERSQELLDLFALEKNHPQEFLWQDRTPVFMDLYHHFNQGLENLSQIFVLKNDDDEIVGSNVLVRVPSPPFFSNYHGYYDTDLFIAPAYRKKGILLDFIPQRQDLLMQNLNGDPHSELTPHCYGYGIENITGSLQKVAEVAPTRKIYMGFTHSSVLHEVFITHLLKESFSRSDPMTVRRKLLRDLTLDEVLQMQKLFQSRPTDALMYHWGPDFLSALMKLDPQAHFLQVIDKGQVQLSALLLDFQQVRRFRVLNPTGLIQERLRKFWPITEFGCEKDEILHSLIVGQWRSAPQATLVHFQLILKEIYEICLERGYQSFYVRDFPEESLQGFRSQNSYKRRIVGWCPWQDQEIIKKQNLTIENLFL